MIKYPDFLVLAVESTLNTQLFYLNEEVQNSGDQSTIIVGFFFISRDRGRLVKIQSRAMAYVGRALKVAALKVKIKDIETKLRWRKKICDTSK